MGVELEEGTGRIQGSFWRADQCFFDYRQVIGFERIGGDVYRNEVFERYL